MSGEATKTKYRMSSGGITRKTRSGRVEYSRLEAGSRTWPDDGDHVHLSPGNGKCIVTIDRMQGTERRT